MSEDEAIAVYTEAIRLAATAAAPLRRVRFWRPALVFVGALCALPDFLSLNGIVARRSITGAPRWKRSRLWLEALVGAAVLFPFSLVRQLWISLVSLLCFERRVDPAKATHVRIAPRDWPWLALNTKPVGLVAGDADVIIVPGFAEPLFSGPLTPRGQARCDLAADDFHAGRAPLILVSGGNVHPRGTPFNEAVEMRRYLVESRGVPRDRVLIEPLAQHTQTNLRNAGRIMLRLGLRKAIIVSDAIPRGQPVMFQIPDCSGFGVQFRARWFNGVSLGRFSRIDDSRTYFHPSADVFCVLRHTTEP